MSRAEWNPTVGLLLLGAMHGINPGMGWLFAVARGFQQGAQRAVWGALGPLALGHGLAIAAALVFAALLGSVVPGAVLRSLVGVALVVRGFASLVRHRHPRGGGMRVSARELTWWSFLMATGHGAGLMALPLVLSPAAGVAHALHGGHVVPGGAAMAMGPGAPGAAVVATAAHTIGYLGVTALVAVIVYERIGVRMLRSSWINLDLLWAVALIVTGVVAVVV